MDDFAFVDLKPVRHKDRVYQLKITLQESDPPIWRRVQVAGDATLKRLHRIVQKSMGWTESHLHEFIIDGVHYSDPAFDLDESGDEVESQNRIKLRLLGLRPGDTFEYSYDFGDGWSHQIQVETVFENDGRSRYPVCIGGERACPPEDSGGI